MIPIIQFKNMNFILANYKRLIMQKYKINSQVFPIRRYIVYYKQSEVDSEAAEANPIKHLYQEEIIQEMTEVQRMVKFSMKEPKRIFNIKGVYPEMVEDVNFKALPSISKESSLETKEYKEVKLDELDEEQAIDIINEMHKND